MRRSEPFDPRRTLPWVPGEFVRCAHYPEPFTLPPSALRSIAEKTRPGSHPHVWALHATFALIFSQALIEHAMRRSA